MTEYVEIKVSLEESALIAFECKNCGGEITLNIADKKQRGMVVDDNFQRFGRCPLCGNFIDSGLREAFEGLFNWYDAVQKSGHKVFFKFRKAV
jgi:predicted RNA-binding Zn-ribbon protein involved in translation (DUF1610 family)